MKHPLKITLLLIWLFLTSQIIGLILINMDAVVTREVNELNQTIVKVSHNETAVGERPQTKGVASFLLLVVGLLIGTIILLLISKFGKFNIWRAWYFLAVWLAMSIAFGVFLWKGYAMILALALAFLKVYKRNPVIHNLTEIFVYSGIALLLAPILNLLWAFILLLIISAYDMFAVWKSKHMVKMALFQAKSEIFAGLFIPRGKIVKIKEEKKEREISGKGKEEGGIAVLGGGDIAFPLIFTSVCMEYIIILGIDKIHALFYSLIITLFSTIALSLLFFFAKKHRFYPAMPFISVGCFLGFGLLLLIL